MSQDQFRSFEGTWERLSQVAVQGAQYDSRERQPHPKCLEGTRVDLLNHIHTFLDDREKSHLIWLHGTAGVGKSAVAFTVAERMRGLKVTEQTNVEKRLAGTFFFSRKHTTRCTTGYFFATLVYQLASNFPSIREDVNKSIRDNPALLDPNNSLRDQMEALFLQPLRRLRLRLRGCPPLTFIVDALDECTSESELTDLILALARALREPDLPVTHILLTSRSESHICKAFQVDEVHPLVCEIPVKISGEGVTTIISLDGADVDNDIYIVLRHSFKELQSRHPDFPQPSTGELERLASRAGRRFIVASTMMKFIDDGDNDPYDRLQLMLELTSELLPGTEVYKLYDCILSTCADPKRAYLHLSVVAALADPLPMLQISKLLGSGLGRDVETVLMQLRSLVDIPTDGTLPMNIYHSSIRDYVSDPANCRLPQVHDMPSPHSLLAQSSLRLMIKEIPESSALLDALSKLKRHSQAMKAEDPHRLNDSLAFLVQLPDPLSVLVGLLWIRGDRSSDLQFWLETLDGQAWLQTQSGQAWLQTLGMLEWLQTDGGLDWLETQGGRDWMPTQGGRAWLPTLRGQEWLPTLRGRAWLRTEGGREWLRTEGGREWLRTEGGREWLRTEEGREWLRNQGGREWLQTDGGREWLQTQGKEDWLRTPGKEDWLQTEGGQEWLQTQYGREWLQTQYGREWLRTEGGREWLQTEGGHHWLRTQGGGDWLRSEGGRDWLKSEREGDWLRSEGGRDWLETKGGREWLETQDGKDWLLTQAGQYWLQTLGGQDWLLTQGLRGWLHIEGGQDWLQTEGGKDWLQTEGGRDWVQTEGGRDWLQTGRGRDWLRTEAGPHWLRAEGGRNWLQTGRGRDWLWTEGGQSWLQTVGGQDWLWTGAGKNWLWTEEGQDWLQTQTGQNWLQTQAGQDWLQIQGEEDSVQTQGVRAWVQNPEGVQDWLQTGRGKNWLQTQGGQEWVQTQGGREWLQTQGGQDWVQTRGGREWLQTLHGRDWLHAQGWRGWLRTQGLHIQTEQDWLLTPGGQDWLLTWAGQDWLPTQEGRDWLQTSGGRDWLQTPHGKAWRCTPAASVWVAMEEFWSTLEAISEFIIVPELPLSLAFQAVQQLKSLPDFLMFPMFLALRQKDHSISGLPQSRFPSEREIIHAINAFTTFATEAQERSQSASDALKYACQSWPAHLSRASNPWDNTLNHIFQAFWNRHLVSWLERQWCLKGLRSSLVVLSEGQKFAKSGPIAAQPNLPHRNT